MRSQDSTLNNISASLDSTNCVTTHSAKKVARKVNISALLLRTFSLIFVASLGLSACSTLPQFAPHTPEEMDKAHEATKAELAAERAIGGTASMPKSDEKLPDVKLSSEILFKILTSEIAFQRGNWQAAYVTILSVAQQTRDPRLARRATEIALTARQPSEALSAIRLWRELAPESNEAAQYYLGFMAISNNLPEIQSIYANRLKKADPKQYAALMLQAQRLLGRGSDKAAGFAALEQLLAPYLAFAESHLALAQGAYTNGDNARALKEANIVLQIQPDSQLGILTIAQASGKSDAADALRAFLEKNPNARDIRLAYAGILIELKQFDKAQTQFEQILRDKPEDATALYTLGAIAMELKDFNRAEKLFNAYLATIAANPVPERDSTPALLNLSQIALERKDQKAALAWLAKVDAFDGRNTAWLSVQFRRAQLLANDKQLSQARELLQNIKFSSDAEQIQILQTEAQLLRNAKQSDEAMLVYKKALEKFPDNPDLLYDYALLLESQKKTQEMESALRRVIAIAPESPHAYNALGYSFADRNERLDEALALIEKALSLTPNDAFILDSLGWVKFKLGDFAAAEQALRRAYQIRPDAEIAIHLGEVLWTIGRKEEARQLWRDAKAKDPENETLRLTLTRLNARL